MNGNVLKAVILASAMTTSVNATRIAGTVTNKTTGKPSAGDKVALVDPSAGMADAATTVTSSEGKYALQVSGAASYLIRVDHQGASYFIAAPQNGSPADVTVYDVAAKVQGVGIDADMLLIEAGRGTLHVRERYLIRNASSPPLTQFSDNTFEVALPDGAHLEEAAATRPGGMGTRTHLIPLAQEGHYAFNVPIQPDQGEKETMYEVAYHFSYNGRQTINIRPIAPADHLVVYTAKGIEFAAKEPSRFKAAREDARVETHVALGLHPGEEITFSVSGEGQMPPDTTAAAMQMGGLNAVGGKLVGGNDAPTRSPDSLIDSKYWLPLGVAVLLAGTTFLILRRPRESQAASGDALSFDRSRMEDASTRAGSSAANPPSSHSNALLETLKEELFTLEQERISGLVAAEEYSQIKTGLEAILKRALKSQRH